MGYRVMCMLFPITVDSRSPCRAYYLITRLNTRNNYVCTQNISTVEKKEKFLEIVNTRELFGTGYKYSSETQVCDDQLGG